MASPDPSANGNPDTFEMRLEPVDPIELQIDEIPTVEAVAPRLPGFGFGRAILWCLLFLLVSQAIPAIFLAVLLALAVAFGSNIPLDDKLLSAPDSQPLLQISILMGHVLSIDFR